MSRQIGFLLYEDLSMTTANLFLGVFLMLKVSWHEENEVVLEGFKDKFKDQSS